MFMLALGRVAGFRKATPFTGAFGRLAQVVRLPLAATTLPRQSTALFFSSVSDQTAAPSVFIGNMPFSLSEDDLKNLVVEKLGGAKFASLKIAKDKATRQSRGFGYVNFESQQDAEEAVSKLAGLAVDGREFRVDLSVPKEQRPPRTEGAPRTPRGPLIPADRSVFIGNLDFSVTDTEILAMCNDILGEGMAVNVRLATDRETGTLVDVKRGSKSDRKCLQCPFSIQFSQPLTLSSPLT